MKLNKKIRLLISADGGAGSGKTTGSKLLAKKYGLKFLSSGVLYRHVALKLLNAKKIFCLDSYWIDIRNEKFHPSAYKKAYYLANKFGIQSISINK